MCTTFSLVRMIPGKDTDCICAASHLFSTVIKRYRRVNKQERETLTLLVESSQENTENQLIPVIGRIFRRTIS